MLQFDSGVLYKTSEVFTKQIKFSPFTNELTSEGSQLHTFLNFFYIFSIIFFTTFCRSNIWNSTTAHQSLWLLFDKMGEVCTVKTICWNKPQPWHRFIQWPKHHFWCHSVSQSVSEWDRLSHYMTGPAVNIQPVFLCFIAWFWQLACFTLFSVEVFSNHTQSSWISSTVMFLALALKLKPLFTYLCKSRRK